MEHCFTSKALAVTALREHQRWTEAQRSHLCFHELWTSSPESLRSNCSNGFFISEELPTSPFTAFMVRFLVFFFNFWFGLRHWRTKETIPYPVHIFLSSASLCSGELKMNCAVGWKCAWVWFCRKLFTFKPDNTHIFICIIYINVVFFFFLPNSF